MFYRFLPLVSVVLTVLATAWISILPLNGVTQADISFKHPTLITPAGFTFSIWSLIYVTWIVTAVLIATRYIDVSKKQRIIFSVSVALTAVWLFPWHYDYIFASLLVIFAIFAGFFSLFLLTRKKSTSPLFRYTVELIFGWVLAATILNIFVFFQTNNVFQGPGDKVFIALIGLFIGTIIQIVLSNNFKAYIPLLVYLWALWGIYVKQTVVSIRLAAILFSIILVINFIYLRRKSYKKLLKEPFGPIKTTKKRK